MKRVGVREFKEKATILISEEKALVIEKHGKPVGFYIPLPKRDKAELEEAFDHFQEKVAAFLAETGMTEDELVDALTKDWEQSVRDASRG